MATGYSPKIVTDGLVLALDAANRKGISPSANQVWNTAPQFVKNLVSPSDSISALNGVKLGNVQYYTAFAIDYPEGSYGGSAASRDGITPGFNVTSGAKSFNYGRALNYAVFNNKTNSFVKTTVYDSYVGTAAVDTFVSQYNQAVIDYPDAVHIVAGSHRDSYHTTAQYNILRDLGAPSNVDSIIGFSSPEWILVGEPGLGAGNAYVWAFQNYSVNASQVAHAVFPLPIDKNNKNNYWEFDGVDEYISVTDNSTLDLAGDKTLCCWVNLGANSSGCGIVGKSNNTVRGMALGYGWNGNGFMALAWNSANAPYISKDLTRDIGKWVFLTAIQSGSTRFIYVHDSLGVRSGSYSGGIHSWNNSQSFTVGNANNGSNPAPSGTKINLVKVYNRALSASEVLQNYNATKGRFGL